MQRQKYTGNNDDTPPIASTCPHVLSYLRKVPRNVLENRAGRAAPHAAAFHQTTEHSEVSKRFGSLNGLSVTQKQNSVPQGPIVGLLPDQAPGTRRVPPPPRAALAEFTVIPAKAGIQ